MDGGVESGELDAAVNAEVTKNLQTMFELVFTYLQVYANTFEMDVQWPEAWTEFVNKLFLPFSLEFSLFVPEVQGIPDGKLYFRIFVVAIVVPFLFYIAQYFWDEPLQWKETYITRWDETKEWSKMVAGGYSLGVLLLAAILGSAELTPFATGIMILAVGFCAAALFSHLFHMLLIISARFVYTSTPNKLQFFLNMRLRLRKLALFLFLIVYFPIAKELLQHIIGDETAPTPIAAFALSVLLFTLYVIGVPLLLFMVMRKEHEEMIKYYYTTTNESTPNQWESASSNDVQDEAQIENPMVAKSKIRASILQRDMRGHRVEATLHTLDSGGGVEGDETEEGEHLTVSSTASAGAPDYFVLRLRLREAMSMLRELKKRSKQSKRKKATPKSTAMESSDSSRIERLEERVKLLRKEVAECYSEEETKHARLPGNGLPLASLWQPYEPEYYW
jgi:hypothetical protein